MKNPTSPGEGGLTDLISRLEAAEAGSRELDVLIHNEVRGSRFDATEMAQVRWRDPTGYEEDKYQASDADEWGVDKYTTSLDAALALAERVLPGCRVMSERDFDGAGWAMVQKPRTASEGRVITDGSTPALALCIAILRARATNTPEAEGGAG